MRASTRSRLQPLLEEQHGVITSSQLAALPVDAELPRREGWLLLAPRTWCTTIQPTDEQLLQGLLLHCGAGSVPTGPLACRRHGLRDVPDADVADVLVPHGRRLTSGGLSVVHQTLRLPKPVRRRGWRVAPAARAVADAARSSGDLQAVRALVLAALSDLLVRPEDLTDEQRLGPRRGSGALTRALADWRAGARSAPEAEVADALRGLRRLPPFELNPTLYLRGVELGTPDGYLPGLGLGWEVDSVRYHGGTDELADTLARHTRFTDAGLELVHVVPGRFRRGRHAWAEGFAARARRRAAEGRTDPPGLVVQPHDHLQRLARRGAARS